MQNHALLIQINKFKNIQELVLEVNSNTSLFKDNNFVAKRYLLNHVILLIINMLLQLKTSSK